MNKATFSLNYRKPKSEYEPNEELIICIRKYCSNGSEGGASVKQISSGVKCKISDWDSNWHKTSSRSPIKNTDPNHLKKKQTASKKS